MDLGSRAPGVLMLSGVRLQHKRGPASPNTSGLTSLPQGHLGSSLPPKSPLPNPWQQLPFLFPLVPFLMVTTVWAHRAKVALRHGMPGSPASTEDDSHLPGRDSPTFVLGEEMNICRTSARGQARG